MDSDDDFSNDNWNDAEDNEGRDSEWTDDFDEFGSDSSTSSIEETDTSEEEKYLRKAKRQKLAAEEYAESPPQCILPIGMGSIFWQYFGFPVWSDGECLTREYVTCTCCKSMFTIDSPKVIPNMRSHLQQCNKDIYRVVAEQCLKTPLIELTKIPNVLLTDIQGNRMWKWLMKKKDKKHKTLTASPKRSAGKKKRIENAMFMVAVENLRVTMMNTDGDTPAASLIKSMLAIAGNQDFDTPEMNKDIFSTTLSQKYKIAKAGVILALKLCSEYSMCVEEWIDTEQTVFITFSVNYLKKGSLKNSILLTVPKNLDELPLAFERLTKEFGVDFNKVSALVTNSDIPFADFWKSETQTQFLPCFFETIIRAIRDRLFELPYVKALLEKLEFKMWPYGDVQVILTRFEECLLAAEVYGLTPKDKILFQKVIRVIGYLRVAMDTVKFDHPTALISILWPMLVKLQTEFLLPTSEDDEQISEMKKVLMDYLMDVFKQSLLFIQTATLLDPRFRLLDSLPKSAAPQDRILKSLEAIIKSRPASKGSKSDLDPKKQAEVEYEVHFKSEQPCDFLISPLLWWDTSSSAAPLYPNVKLLARQFNCVPISCVTSKRLNAESADYESCRAQLDYFQLDPLLFLNSNMDMIMPGYA